LLGAAGALILFDRPGGGCGAARRPYRHRLGVRLQQLTLLRFFAPVLLTSASVSCVGSLGFVGLMAPHMARFLLRGGQVSLLCGSALIGALLVLFTDTLAVWLSRRCRSRPELLLRWWAVRFLSCCSGVAVTPCNQEGCYALVRFFAGVAAGVRRRRASNTNVYR
jgi:hypothetical protein